MIGEYNPVFRATQDAQSREARAEEAFKELRKLAPEARCAKLHGSDFWQVYVNYRAISGECVSKVAAIRDAIKNLLRE